MRRTTSCPECGTSWPGRPGFCGRCGALLDTGPLASRTVTQRHDDGATSSGRGRPLGAPGTIAVALLGVVAVALAAGLGGRTSSDPPPVRGGVGLPTAAAQPPPPAPQTAEATPRRPQRPVCTYGDALIRCVRWSRTVDLSDVGTAAGMVLEAGHGGVVARDAVTGMTAWRFDVGAARLVTVHDGIVVIDTERTVVGLAVDDGGMRWGRHREYAAAQDRAVPGRLVTTVPTGPGLERVMVRDPTTGTLIQAGPEISADAAVIAEGHVVVIHDRTRRRLSVWDPASGVPGPAWRTSTVVDRTWPAGVSDGVLYVYETWGSRGRGTDRRGPHLRALDLATGATLWRLRIEHYHVTVTDETVVAMTGPDTVSALDPATGAAVWGRTGAERLRPGPDDPGLVLLDVVDARGDHVVELVRTATGETLWQQRVPGDVHGAASVSGGVAIWNDNRLVVLAAGTGDGLGTVETTVTALLSSDPLLVVGAGRMHRIEVGRFTGPGAPVPF